MTTKKAEKGLRPLRVLVLVSWYPEPALPHAGIFFQDQALALARAGHDVTVLHPCLTPVNAMRGTRSPFIRVTTTPLRVLSTKVPVVPRTGPVQAWSFALAALGLFRAYVRAQGMPDVIHAQSAVWAGLGAALIESVYGVPFVVTEHLSTLMQPRVAWWRRAMVRATFSRSSACIAVSRALAHALTAYAPDKSFHVLANTVDLDYFVMPAERESTGFRALVVSNLVPLKRVDRALRAFAAAFNGSADATLEIAGDGPEREQIEALVRSLGLTKHVRMLGRVARPEVRDALQRAHVLLLTSERETFGVIALEALATGVPVIATRCGGPEDFIRPEVGTLVQREDQDGLAWALRDWRRRQSNDRAGVAQACRTHASAFGYAPFAQQLEVLLGEAMEAHRQQR